MNEDIIIAKKILDTGFSVVICHKGMVLTSKKDSIESLNEFINSNLDFSEFAIAMREVNKDHTSLLVKLKIKDIITYKISDKAKIILDSENINCNYLELTCE